MTAGTSPLDGPREFPYIKPSGRRVSQYEAVSCAIQPNERGFDRAGTFLTRADGRPTWDLESTALKSVDWYAFRDPAQMWNRNYVARQQDQEAAIERMVRYARETGLLAGLDPAWVSDGLGRLLVTCTFYEYSIFRAFAFAQREALSDTVAQALTFNATDKVRLYQDIILYQLEMIDAGAPIGDDSRRSIWLEAEEFQAMRRVAERVLATNDWGEVVLMVNLVIEPLLSGFVYQDLLYRGAAEMHDSITPVLLLEADRDRRRNGDYARAFLAMLANDEQDGAANLQVVQLWIDSWLKDVRAAMSALVPLAKGYGLDGQQLMQDRLARWVDDLSALGLSAPAEVHA